MPHVLVHHLGPSRVLGHTHLHLNPKGSLIPSLPPTRTLPGGSPAEISKYLPQTPSLTAVNIGLCLKKGSYGPTTGWGSPETKFKAVNGREFSRPEQRRESPRRKKSQLEARSKPKPNQTNKKTPNLNTRMKLQNIKPDKTKNHLRDKQISQTTRIRSLLDYILQFNFPSSAMRMLEDKVDRHVQSQDRIVQKYLTYLLKKSPV